METATIETNIVWSDGRGATVQLLLDGEYRAINRHGMPRRFKDLEEAIAFAKTW